MTALERLYDWFNDQLSEASTHGSKRGKAVSPPQRSSNIVDRQKLFVKEQVDDMLRKIGARTDERDRIVTVRRKSAENRGYLRPAYAEPNELNAFLSEFSRQTPFSVKYGGDESAFFGQIPSEWRCLDDDVFICIHRVGKDIGGIGTADAETIPDRLTKFWHANLTVAEIRARPNSDPLPNDRDGAQRGKSAKAAPGRPGPPGNADFVRRINKLNARRSPDHDLFCVFAGKLTEKKDRRVKRQLSALCGIYIAQPAGWNPGHEDVASALAHARDLFRGLDIVSQLDSKLFELEGLRAMAELLPRFVDQEIPRSDKISLALARLRELLDRHLVGRPEWQGAAQPKLFYLSASFEQSSKGWFPRLEVYPHAYRAAYPLVSLLVCHARIPSASKFLLKSYLEEHRNKFSAGKGGIKLDRRFTRLFLAKELKVPPIADWRSRVFKGTETTCLHMFADDEVIADQVRKSGRENPFIVLNHSVEGSKAPSKSLLAFVIEGEKNGNQWAFPRGILALESGAIDAFSELDIEALREVVRAFGSLVRLITHDNACVEYRTKLSKAFDTDLRGHLPKVNIRETRRRFVFAVRKIDGEQFHKLLNEAIPAGDEGKPIWKLLRLGAKEQQTLHEFKLYITPHTNASVKGRVKANEIVAARVEWAIAKLKEEHHKFGSRTGNLTDDIVDFLFACTENFQWSAYLSSLAQSLGDRAEKTVPDFQLMSPGYSASRMFMASVRRELRQVVKLSEYSKLNKERKNYITNVRYRFVNAARMPANGFAFDGTGWVQERKGRQRNDRYGALVSDLISAAEKKEGDPIEPIKTFVKLLRDRVINKPLDVEKRNQIINGIHTLFKHGMTLWREETCSEDEDVETLVKSASRLPAGTDRLPGRSREARERNDRIDTLDEALDFYCKIYGDVEKRVEVLDILFDPPMLPRADEAFCQDVYQISHRDLNARNLTWSGALSTFLMIDFEHVGPGYAGVDQVRLWVNAICELYGEATNTQLSEEQVTDVVDVIENLIAQTEALFRHLVKQQYSDNAISTYVSQYFAEGRSGSIKINQGYVDQECTESDYFVIFFPSLFFEMEKIPGIGSLIMYSFFCSILKEFEYSRREVDLDTLEMLLKVLPPLEELTSKKLHAALIENADKFASRQLLSLYFRHLTCARLLSIVSVKTAELRTTLR